MMRIEVQCDFCEAERADDEIVLMESDKHLYFNPDSKTQSQTYKCPICSHMVTVVVYPNMIFG